MNQDVQYWNCYLRCVLFIITKELLKKYGKIARNNLCYRLLYFGGCILGQSSVRRSP